jgi:hypothetical protein
LSTNDLLNFQRVGMPSLVTAVWAWLLARGTEEACPPGERFYAPVAIPCLTCIIHDDFGKSLEDLPRSQSGDLPKKQFVF